LGNWAEPFEFEASIVTRRLNGNLHDGVSRSDAADCCRRMTTLLLVTRDERWRERIGHALPDASIFVAAGESDALRQLRRIEIDLVIWAAGPRGVAFLERARAAAPGCVTLAVASEQDDEVAADFLLLETHTPRQRELVLGQALERHRLLREIAALRARAGAPATGGERAPEAPSQTPTRLLKEFTRILAAGFDLPRTLEIFVDAVIELLRPARMALLLPDLEGRMYRVRVHRGLAPQIAESVRLPADRGLCHWLMVEGRPARAGEFADPTVARELTLLQGAMAVPLLAHGELMAVLIVGPPVVRSAYADHEIETLFDLATHLATAIHGITLHQRLQRASEFRQRILEHMSSGVVTIGADERVSSLNRRAAEILDLDADSVVGQDLRVLPSPLGDMLFETLTTVRSRPRGEIRLALRGLWLEVSTYPVRGDETTGAVLVFEDLTAQKELAAQKRQAEQFELLTRVVARIADEIKNPLVSINTFMELIGERFDDPDFRKDFSAVVGMDVRRLVQVFEKLTGLVSPGELNFITVDVHGIVDEAVAAVQLGEDARRKPIEVHVSRDPAPLRVKADPGQLRKALAYLVWYLGHHSPERASVSVSIGRRGDAERPSDVRIVIGSRTAQVSPQELDQLFDPVRMVQESLIDIGPAVSQRIVEALGGRLEHRQGRNDLSFVMRLPAAV
jgi:PAS domain S-box-containing protein